MRKISVLFLFFIAINAAAQKPGSVDSLYNDFKKIYFASLDKEEHFGAMLDATQWTLQPQNPHYRDVWKLYSKQFNISDEDTLGYRITNTILSYFHERDMWNRLGSTLKKYTPLITAYNEAICPCFTQKIDSIKSPDRIEMRRKFNFQKFITECEQELAKNKDLATTITLAFQKVAVADARLVQNALFLFIYDNCPEYKKLMDDMYCNQSAQSVSEYKFRLSDTIDDIIISLHKRKKIDSLRIVFPDYATYAKHIELAKSVTIRNVNIVFGKNNRDEKIRRDTLTYFKGRTLQGQRIVSYSIEGLDIKVFSFEHYPADKIRNREYIMARMNEDEFFDSPPPPPILRGQ